MLVTTLRDRLGSVPSVVALAARVADKPVVIVATNQTARDGGARAGALARTAAGILGGGGGGKDDLAQGGGTNLDAIPSALAAVTSAVAG
jgi:alanyl-tRNA synthetase